MNQFSSAILVALIATILNANPTQASIPKDYGKYRQLDPWSALPPWRLTSGQKEEPALTNWNEEKYRLPGDLLPSFYAIRLLPFLEEGNFTTSGHIEILVDCVQDTKNIVLNSADITFDVLSISVVEAETNNPLALVGFVDQQVDLQQVTIKTASSLQAGKQYTISMNFVSILNDQLAGFYLSSYIENNVTKYLATTHMEPAAARLAFPCLDEPNMKANFSITLGRKESMTSSSNMPLVETNPIEGMPGYVWDHFATTPTMSSYLVAMLVSEFVSTPSDSSLSNVAFRVITRPDLQQQSSYAANIGPRILEYFESYFEIDYPLPKEDMAAIPDFGPGAMENWGHMDFRENYLLVDEATTTAAGKQLVSEVISHELAHQWFGDLVTLDWWSVTWLNEGFARYLQYLGVNSVEPQYRMLELFPINTLQRVFATDSLPSSHAMSKPIDRSSIFDTITYDKGASVIRMCAGFLGEESFQRGLTRYLSKNAYENTMEEDLWNTLEEQAAIDGVILPASLVKIMGSWTQNKNYPWIKVTRDYSGNIDGALVEQHRFVVPEIDGSTEPIVTYWWIPLTFTHDFELNPSSAWLEATKEKKLVSLSATNDQWVIFNLDQTGFYRVAYDDTNYDLIATQLIANHSRISIINRAQLLDDALNLAKLDIISYTRSLNLTLYLKEERDYVPWHSAVDEFSYIDNMLRTQNQYADWKNYMTALVRPLYNYVGFEESETDAHLTILTRTDALNWACRLKIADCVENVQNRYAAVMENPQTELSPNQKSFILCSGVENGAQKEWDFALGQYQSGNSDYLVPITCTRESNILYNLLDKMLDPTYIRSEDVDTLFSNIAANPLGNPLATNFLVNRWEEIENVLGTGHFVVFFRSLCDRKNTQEQYNTLVQLRDAHLDILGDSVTVEDGLLIIQSNIKWMQSNQLEIGDWLLDTPVPTEPTSPTTKTTNPTTTQMTTESGTGSSTTVVATTPSTVATTPGTGTRFHLSLVNLVLPIALIGRFILNKY